MARPTSYTAELGRRICSRLADGESLLAICRDADMPSEALVRSWVIDNLEGFAAIYTRARDIGIDCEFDKIIEVARDGSNDWMETEKGTVPDHEHINRSRLIVDTMKWRLAKLAPKRYGDRLELAGDKDNPLVVQQLTAAETIRRKRQERLKGSTEEKTR